MVLRGYVANPGPRALLSVPTVRDLLGSVSDLRFDTYMPMAILVRRDPATAARVFEPVNLLTAMAGRPNVPLRSDDRLYVFSRSDIDFLNRGAVRRVVLGRPNPLPACTSLDRLQALVGDTQSARFTVVTRGSFVVERGGASEIASTGGSLSGASRQGDEAFRTGDDVAAVARSPAPAEPDGETVAADAANQNVSARVARPSAETARCPAVFEEEPELLPVLIENAVGVGGAVRRPGAYPIAGSISASDLANAAEGVLTSASELTLDITRASGGSGQPAADRGRRLSDRLADDTGPRRRRSALQRRPAAIRSRGRAADGRVR